MTDRELVERDILIGRVLEGQATEADWAAFRAVAERDAGLWRDLGDAQREHGALSRAVNAAVSIADGIDAPVHDHMAAGLNERVRLLATWGGWAAAAAVLVAWSLGMQPRTDASGRAGSQAAILGGGGQMIGSTADALSYYLDKGQQTGEVVGEIPTKILLETRPIVGGGGYEVVYIRQIVERAVVTDMWKYAENDAGQPEPVLLRQRAGSPM